MQRLKGASNQVGKIRGNASMYVGCVSICRSTRQRGEASYTNKKYHLQIQKCQNARKCMQAHNKSIIHANGTTLAITWYLDYIQSWVLQSKFIYKILLTFSKWSKSTCQFAISYLWQLKYLLFVVFSCCSPKRKAIRRFLMESRNRLVQSNASTYANI